MMPTHTKPASPCINVCEMQTDVEALASGQASALCKGCARTIAEIAAWGGMSDADKQAVWQQLPARLAGMQPSRKAR